VKSPYAGKWESCDPRNPPRREKDMGVPAKEKEKKKRRAIVILV